MNALRRLFIEHPASVNETYLQHLGTASFFGSRLIIAGFACLIHGLLPCLFTSTGSRAVSSLYQRMVTNRARSPETDASNRSSGSSLVLNENPQR